MSSLVELAHGIATKAHEGQVDKAGKPYIDHPVHVASRLETDEEKAVGLLHDVIEDTSITADDLLKAGIPQNVVDAIKAMTHPDHLDYFEYLKELKQNPLAVKVKIQDLLHNSDLSRIEKPTAKDFARLEKYKKALAFLTEK
ncbi:MAG: HD domain-containing protein [Lachnospiraceae bacterium]|nr:HD domain-containing protein [Lachnospiraceae bacterium]